MMFITHRLGLFALLIAAAFLSGFFYGRISARQTTLTATVQALETRERIDRETADLSLFNLCLELGGLRDDCALFMRRLDKAAQSQ